MIFTDVKTFWLMRTRPAQPKVTASQIPMISRPFVGTALALAALVAGASAAAVPAFPGAEGAGALAVGGRGGVVCKVTNLNDSGPGSLRDCVAMSGPRTVVFEVGGTIKLRSRINITNPYLTIAGQTAPGGGIQIKADKASLTDGRGDLVVSTHDVVVRYLRFRRGKTGHNTGNVRAGSNARDVIFDHLSFSWAEDQNFTVWGYNKDGAQRNITLQNSILVEMLDRVNLLTGAADASSAEAMTNLDFHNNLLMNARHRNPLIKSASARWVNNIVYNWYTWASRTVGGVHMDWISNLYKPGPLAKQSQGKEEIMAVRWSEEMSDPSRNINRDPSLYVVGNRGILSGMDPDTDNWPYTREAGPNDNGQVLGPIPLEWRRYQPLPTAGVPITVRHADDLENHLLPIVGASKRLDCEGNWVFNRDSVDERVISEYLKNEGTLISHEDEVGGYPKLASGVPCKDTSGDGVPDMWAIASGLDASDPTLGKTVHESGYTYLELYLNGMQIGPPPPAGPTDIKVE